MKNENKITRKYVTVTPQKAAEWLKSSPGNRPIKSGKVALFAQYMAAGEWNKDAQPIYFDEDGRLLDGHTRLNAVIASDTTVEMEVKCNFPRAEWNKLNIGSIWTAGDFATANGIISGNSSMAAVKIRETLRRGLRIGALGCAIKGKSGGRVWTNDDFLNLFKADDDWITDIQFAESLYRQWHGISVSMCAGVIHHLVHDCGWGRDFVCEFFRQVYTLERMTSNSRTLRKRIDFDRSGGSTLTPNYICLLIVRAFEGYAMSIPKNKLQIKDLSQVPTFVKRRA